MGRLMVTFCVILAGFARGRAAFGGSIMFRAGCGVVGRV